jgi:hypothetical protein
MIKQLQAAQDRLFATTDKCSDLRRPQETMTKHVLQNLAVAVYQLHRSNVCGTSKAGFSAGEHGFYFTMLPLGLSEEIFFFRDKPDSGIEKDQCAVGHSCMGTECCREIRIYFRVVNRLYRYAVF